MRTGSTVNVIYSQLESWLMILASVSELLLQQLLNDSLQQQSRPADRRRLGVVGLRRLELPGLFQAASPLFSLTPESQLKGRGWVSFTTTFEK